MSIIGIANINIGLPNESTNSDSLFTAFTKTQTNFTTLFNSASPFNTFTAGTGVNVVSDNTSGTVTVTNTGVTNIVAGTNIIINQSNGNVTISSTGGGNGGGGTVTSIGVVPADSSRITSTGGPVISAGNITIDLAQTGVTPGTYTYPTMTIDSYGRVSSISSGNSLGTVTSVGIVPGAGIQVTGSPITTSGNINIINTGVTRLSAGAGILLSGANGNVTISTSLTGGTVTSVGLTSSSLTVTGSPITSTGTMTVDLPSNVTVANSVSIGTFVKLNPLASAPSPATAGMVYYNSGTNTLQCYNGTAWKTITMS
jgi:hypothetical protein